MVNNCININKMNNHLYRQTIEHKNTKIYGVGFPGLKTINNNKKNPHRFASTQVDHTQHGQYNSRLVVTFLLAKQVEYDGWKQLPIAYKNIADNSNIFYIN